VGFIPPLKPTLVREPPTGDGWIHEIKHDGFRTQIAVDRGTVLAYTSSGYDWTARYRRVALATPYRRAASR
jgi:bifunctional non-homologous end joining protein LigD